MSYDRIYKQINRDYYFIFKSFNIKYSAWDPFGLYPLEKMEPEIGTFEWWISRLMLDPHFSLISRFNNACSPLQINEPIE